jgi:acyl-CoA:6-aminopenicillanic acid acyl transferase
LSRNFDFPAGTMPWSTKEPYLMEVYPDEGYPHIAMGAYDLLGTVTDGINSEGLAVAFLSDHESPVHMMDEGVVYQGPYFEQGMDPVSGRRTPNAVGIQETQLVKFLLETCKDAVEARRALMMTKNYYSVAPLHYIVCDKNGDGFVYEGAQQGVFSKFTEVSEGALCVTNHSVFKKNIMTGSGVEESLGRLNRLTETVKTTSAPYDMSFIRSNAESVAATSPAGAGQYQGFGNVPSRTLWHGYYDLDERSVSFNYYLRDEGPDESPEIIRSEEITFSLSHK